MFVIIVCAFCLLVWQQATHAPTRKTNGNIGKQNFKYKKTQKTALVRCINCVLQWNLHVFRLYVHQRHVRILLLYSYICDHSTAHIAFAIAFFPLEIYCECSKDVWKLNWILWKCYKKEKHLAFVRVNDTVR